MTLLGVVAAAGLLTGCASDGPAAAPVDTEAPTGPRECAPVNADLESAADRRIAVEASDFAFDRPEYRAEAGVITFEMDNVGVEEHELAFLPGGGDVPFVGGEPDEAALEAAGAFELEAFGPGRSCTATYDLEPGTYTLFCIVGTDDGETHYDKGMRSTLVVT